MTAAVPVVVLAAGLGAVAGVGIRLLLGRLRRGVVLRTGAAESAAAVITGIGVGVGWGDATVGLALLTGLLLVALGAVDIVHHRLPDAITLPALPVAAVAVLLTTVLAPGSGSLISAVVAAVVLWALFSGIALLSPPSMGRGDVKLVPTLGLLMGDVSPVAVLAGLLVAFGAGSVVALFGVAARRLRLTSAIPLGPYLLFGCWVVLLFPATFRGG
jgi:leader peptidase (prepilin peptidase)/N-methyltransferase